LSITLKLLPLPPLKKNQMILRDCVFFWATCCVWSERENNHSTDLLRSIKTYYTSTNIQFFSVFLGHFMDQKRLKQGLYRHPWDDISYVLPEQYN